MPDFETSVDAVSAKWGIKIKIEGVGHWLSVAGLAATDGDGQTCFYTSFPDYVDGSSVIHRDYLTEMPDLLSSRINPVMGGLATLGGFEFSLLDVGDYLTDLLRVESAPVTRLDAAITAGAASCTVRNNGGDLSGDEILFIGSEAIRVTTVNGSGVCTITHRGHLGTEAMPHGEGDPVFLYTPFLEKRRVTVIATPLDGADAGEDWTAGTFTIDPKGVSWSDDLNTWNLRCSSQESYLNRGIPHRPDRQVRVVTPPSAAEPDRLVVDPVGRQFASALQYWTGSQADSSNLFYMRTEAGEIVSFRNWALANGGFIGQRGVLDTKIESIQQDEILRQVFIADDDFRWSPKTDLQTTRGSATGWNKTSHWVDLILILATSAATEDDGHELVNYNASYGNWSSLPAGYGAGQPHETIDWASWVGSSTVQGVRDRTPDYLFPYFVYGDETAEFGELISERLLKPAGAYLITEGGLAKVVLPRIPLQGSTTVALGTDDILTRKMRGGADMPRIKVGRSSIELTESIIYRVGPSGVEIAFHADDFGGTYGRRGMYADAPKPIIIDVPDADPAAASWLEMRTMRALFRVSRPTSRFAPDVTMSHWDSTPGTLVSVTCPEIPDLKAGTRGWTDVVCEVTQHELRPDPDVGLYVALETIGYGGGSKAGRVAPSAYIESCDEYTCTVYTNRYTHTDASGSDIPTSDAAGFAAGDIVQIFDLDGTEINSETQEVQSVAGDEIELDGDFAGALASDQILGYASYADSIAQQTDTRVYLADRDGNQDIGTSGVDPWEYAEP